MDKAVRKRLTYIARYGTEWEFVDEFVDAVCQFVFDEADTKEAARILNKARVQRIMITENSMFLEKTGMDWAIYGRVNPPRH